MNTDNKTVNSEKFIKSIQLTEINNDTSLVAEAIILLNEYGNYMYGDLELIAGKESFFKEIEHFPGSNYLPPPGIFIVAKAGDILIGCVGVKKFEEDSCELKRMYIRSAFRGKGIGKLLCNFVIEWCRKSGYRRILLDTNLEMKEALALYHECGFKEIEPYCINENNHPVFMEYVLSN